jgi:hypothetical protein
VVSSPGNTRELANDFIRLPVFAKLSVFAQVFIGVVSHPNHSTLGADN